MLQIKKETKIPILCAFIQWFVTTVLQIDRAFFTYDHETKYYLIVKFLYLVTLLITWKFGFEVYKNVHENKAEYKRGVQIFSVYFVLLMVVLLILWPGTWAWDDVWVLDEIREYTTFCQWQHIITGIYQDIILQILPFPGGIILLQNIIISTCVAFIVTNLEQTFNVKCIRYSILDIVLKILPFLLPPVLMYQFSGYRMGLYVYLELTAVVMVLSAKVGKTSWKWSTICVFSFLTIIVSTWRTESLFYIPFFFVALFLISPSILSVIGKIICILVISIGFLCVNRYQNHELGNSNYQIMSLIRPCTELVRIADIEKDREELEILNRVIDVDVIFNNPMLNGEELYWNTNCVRNMNDSLEDDYNEEDYKNFTKAFVRLALKHPKTVIEERWKLFIRGSGITDNTCTNVSSSAMFFEENNGNIRAAIMISRNWIANAPVFRYTRTALINILGGNTPSGTEIGVVKRLVWNAIIPIIILLCTWIKLLFQKKWYYWLICSAVMIKLPIIILTQPSAWIMYLLSFYLLGYVVIVYQCWILFSKRKMSEKNE